jgi:23S rRNA (uracil1939-C5)-methyltransferase
MPQRTRAVPVRRGDRIDLDIDSFADGPDALARVGTYVVLVPGALPGERVRAEITSAARKFGRARVLSVERRSSDRAQPACRHFLACGGCHLQHVRYAAQLASKRARLERELAHALKDPSPVRDPVPAAAPLGQRHKIALHLTEAGGRLVPALHGLREQRLVALRECPASAPPALELALAAVRALDALRLRAFDPDSGAGLLRSVLVRTASTGQSHLVLVAQHATIPGLARVLPELHRAGATAISVNENQGPPDLLLGRRTRVLSGPGRIEERIDGVTYCISPDAFFQTSPHGAGALVRLVRDALAPAAGDAIVDVYCGGGLFALPLARSARRVVGLDASRAAIGDAIAAARRNGIDRARFRCGPLVPALRALRHADLAVLDPPRAGCDPAALRAVADLRPRRLALVACDARALARDLHLLEGLGYRAAQVVPVDMFPLTCHIEAVATVIAE